MNEQKEKTGFDKKTFLQYLSFKICPHEIGLGSFSGNKCSKTWDRVSNDLENNHQCFLCWDNTVDRFKEDKQEA